MIEREYGCPADDSAGSSSFAESKKPVLGIGAVACVALSLFNAASVKPASSERPISCWNGPGVYGYAGIDDNESFDGLQATIAEKVDPTISSGHVSAWIGFGGEGLGPGGSDEWLQAGIDRVAGLQQSNLYYEITLPHQEIKYVSLGKIATDTPESIRFTMLSHKPERWALSINGRRRGPIFSMPADHKVWPATFTSESWISTKARPGCNVLRYTFSNMRIRQPSSKTWTAPQKIKKLDLDGYAPESLTNNGFTAVTITAGS